MPARRHDGRGLRGANEKCLKKKQKSKAFESLLRAHQESEASETSVRFCLKRKPDAAV